MGLRMHRSRVCYIPRANLPDDSYSPCRPRRVRPGTLASWSPFTQTTLVCCTPLARTSYVEGRSSLAWHVRCRTLTSGFPRRQTSGLCCNPAVRSSFVEEIDHPFHGICGAEVSFLGSRYPKGRHLATPLVYELLAVDANHAFPRMVFAKLGAWLSLPHRTGRSLPRHPTFEHFAAGMMTTRPPARQQQRTH